MMMICNCQGLPLPQDEILASGLSVEHLVPYSGVEFVRVSLPCFMELKSYLGVNSKTEVVVHHVQGRSERSDL